MPKKSTKVSAPEPAADAPGPVVEKVPVEKDEPRTKKTPLPPPVAMACRMSPELAKRIKGKFRVSIPIPKDDTVRDVTVGARLFLREWIGAPTGRADLVRVIAVSVDDGEPGYEDRCTVERAWCWMSGKLDDDLAFLGLTLVPDHFPAVGY